MYSNLTINLINIRYNFVNKLSHIYTNIYIYIFELY